MIVRILVYMIAACVAALLLGSISEQRLISYDSQTAVFVFAAVLGVVNAAIKPVLQLLALPVSCLTFGLFALVINAALFALSVWLTPGMQVTTAGAVLGAILTSVAGGVIFSLVDEFAAERHSDRA
jgi:putative membrane protein